MAFSYGLANGTDVPTEHLDYDHIGNCNSASEVEKILKILTSNEEGYYPELIKFTEKKLAELNPKSKLLIKTEQAKKLSDLPLADSQNIAAELEQWENQVTGEDASLQASLLANQGLGGDSLVNGGESTLPPIRTAGIIGEKEKEEKQSSGKAAQTNRIKSSDYHSWDKFDVEKECAKAEKDEEGKKKEKSEVSNSNCQPLDVKLSERELSMSAVEKERLALREKNKGNEAFRSGDYQEALTYYSKSIELEESAPAYNNRAIALIKLERHQEAIQDCSKVLQLEPTNTKALLRRGTALVHLKRWEEAEGDLEQVLHQEPSNKRAQELLNQTRKQGIKTERVPTKKKGRRVQIEEVDEREEDSSKDSNAKAATSSSTPIIMPTAAPKAPPPIPDEVLKLKEKGNNLFRRGQYGEAVSIYTKAIHKLEKASEDHTPSISVLLNNRAACHLKNGSSSLCVTDCTQSLQLNPVNIKALIRRAQAYEHMEKYRLAYIDNQLALSIDRSMVTVYEANSRISKLLKDLDGPNWREKLPQHPDEPRMKQALYQQQTQSSTSAGSAIKDPTGACETKPPTTAEGSTKGVSETNTNATAESSANRVTPEVCKESNSSGSNGVTAGVCGENKASNGVTAGVCGENKASDRNDGESMGINSSVEEENNAEAEVDSSPNVPDVSPPITSAPPPDPVTTSTASPPPTSTAPPPPSVTIYTANNFKTEVTQATSPVSTTTCSQPTSPPKQPSNSEKFEKAKTQGNGYVRKGQYLEALNYYSLCIDACPDNVVGFTNRALCHLKLSSPLSAEEDCSKALELEPTNIKALYRRALSRKATRKFADAMKDLKQLLELDSMNSAAKTEYEEIKKMWEKDLRKLQEKSKQVQEKPPRGSKANRPNKKKVGSDQKKKGSHHQPHHHPPAPSVTSQHEVLQQLLAETKTKMEELRKEVTDLPDTSSEHLTASKTAYYNKTQNLGQQNPRRRKKIVVKEEEETVKKKKKEPVKNKGEEAVKDKVKEAVKDKVKEAIKDKVKEAVKDKVKEAVKDKVKEVVEDKIEEAVKDKVEEAVKDKVEEDKEEEAVKDKVEEDKEEEAVKDKVEEADKEEDKEKEEEEELVVVKQEEKVKNPPQATKGKCSKERQEECAKLITSPYEFSQCWNSIPRTGSAREYARLLQRIPPGKIPQIITNKLEGPMLTSIISAITEEFVPQERYQLSVDILENLSKVPRFQMIAMFLGKKEKTGLSSILSTVEGLPDISKATTDNIRKAYGVNT